MLMPNTPKSPKTPGWCRTALISLLFIPGIIAPCLAGTVTVNAPGQPNIYASAIDQPQLSALARDIAGNIITDGQGNPVVFDPYIDTGSSGCILSYLTSRGYTITDPLGGTTAVPGLGIDGTHGEFIDQYTDYGVGGREVGDVTKPLGLMIRNGQPLEATFDLDTLEIIPPVVNLAEFNNQGSHSLWVRCKEGFGERTQVDLGPGLGQVDLSIQPMDIVGMPVIQNNRMVMDLTTIGASEDELSIGRMTTSLLPKGSAVPRTNMTFNLGMHDYAPTAPAGETMPAHASNPVFNNVTIRSAASGQLESSSGNVWLFDTGSTSSMISFAKAKEIGLIDVSYATMADYMADFTGLTLPIAGIGSLDKATYAPILTLDDVSIPAADGTDVVWNNVDVLVVDVPGLEGVFGLNLLLPAMTIDTTDPEKPQIVGSNDGYFDSIVFDVTGSDSAQLGLYYNPAPEPASLGILLIGAALLVGRRKRQV